MKKPRNTGAFQVVGVAGFEPATSCSQSRYVNAENQIFMFTLLFICEKVVHWY